MILPTGATVAVADGETVRLFHNTGVKPGMHLVEITAAPPAPAHSGSGRREQAMSWLFWSMSGVGPTFGQLLHFVSAEDGSPSAVRRFIGEAVRLVHVLERRLGEAAFLAEEYSIADIAAFTWVNFAMPTVRSNSRDALGATPAVDQWLGEINNRPAVQRGLRAPKIVVGRAKPIS